ncbi:MAG: PKD domain-containing protein, partial [Halioglobus sp.]
MKGFIRAIILALVAFSPLAFSDDEMRDFYAEPGVNPFRTAAGQDPTENIDPFSGNVQLSYVDLSIPGNGGLDLDISRYYNLPQSSPGYANPSGYGWTMHFGRITIGSGHARQLCANAAVPGGDTVDNPAIEMPSGGRELLVRSSVLDDGTYITKSNWRAKCIDDTDYTRGIVATAPDGTAYYMREYVFMQGEDGPNGEAAPTVETWLTNQVVDAYGNTLDVTYLEIASGMKLVSRIAASDGRQVLFEYLDTGDSLVSNSSVNARLSAIQANGQRWLYEYAPISGGEAGWGLIDHYELTAVVRPDGTRWLYEYGSDETAPEYRRLTMVTYPTGGKISYSYQLIRPYLPNPDFTVVAIDTKTQTNPGYPVGNWTYEFEPGSVDFADLGVQPLPENSGRLADLTKITTPAGVEHVYHVGYWALVGTHEILWEMGLKIRHEFFAVDPASGALDIVRRVSNSWASRTISDEVYRGGILSALWDSRTYAPALSRQTVVLDGHTYATDYSNYDAFGNPGTTRQYSIYPTENDTRVTTTTYLNEINGWFIGLPETATLHQDGVVVGTISRTYNALGRLQSEDRFGVTTQYAYTDQGDVALVTDALGHSTSYSEYFRGVAQLHELPDGSERSSMINPSGTIASKTSGRGHTTVFAYDSLNRLTGINYPVNASVSISYHAAGKVLTRGVYREAINWDGFGRQTSVIREDLVNGSRYTNTFVYDESGRKVFASDVNSAGGISWVYDNIGRTLRVTNQDGSYKSISYEGAHRELHQDENNNVVDYRFQVYGSPENRFLSWTLSPEGIATHIRRDGYGNVAWIFQGALDAENPNQYRGYIQSYGYNERLQLSSIDSPADIGLTTFGRDVVGNMTSKQVGASATTVYRYDAMGRIETVDYPEESLDIRNIYDADGQVISVTNGYAARHYAYDENGSLANESVEAGGALYQLDYLMDELDHLSVLTYPSGRAVHYSPDALGRASQAMPYLSNVSYYPDGSLEKMVYANGRIADFTRTITNRLHTIHIDGLIDLDYQYDPAGNVTAIQDLLSPSSTRAMSYDGLHRLKSVQAGWGGSVYDYDAYSNLIRKSDPARNNRSQYYRYLGLLLDRISFEGVAASRGFTYDDYGNINYSDDVIYDVLTGLPLEVRTTRQHLFDDAGNLVFSRRSSRDELDNVVALTSGSFSSEYDGKNNRIRKINHSNGNHVTDYLHSNDGLLRGEYDDAGVVYGNEYFYLGKRPIATAKYNSPPVVSAGDDIQVYSGATVQLSASHADIDGEVVSSVWSQVSGPEVVLDNPASSDTFFIAPNLADTAFIVLQYAAVDDNGAQTTQLVTVSVAVNFPPIADAGLDQNVLAATAVELDGSASSDVEGPVTYNWSGSYLADEFKVNPTIQFPELGFNYSKTYTLTVTDAQGAIDTDTVEINVYTSTADADEDGLPDGWEVVHFGDTTSYGETDDPDGDGVLNAQEWVDSTSPVLADEPTAVSKIAIIAGDGENVVVWARTPAAAQFDVYWSEDASSPVATWQRASVTRRYFEHAALANSATYHYVVVAANALGVAEPSPAVHGTPGAHAWKPPQRQPDGLTSLAVDATWVATNRFGDTVLLAQKYEESVHRLYLWQSSMFDDFGTVELVNEDSDPQGFAKVAIDQDGNVMVSWAGGPVGSRNLYAAYRPYGKPFR